MIQENIRHYLIEASAGTGKTYTIEQVVHDLLNGEGLPLEQILVVTFTEKAAGELRTRLRLRLEEALPKAGKHRAVVQHSLDAFDQAPIFTIHGFCQRLLREYPLEQGQEFSLELVSRQELLRPALREVQRHWPETHGAGLTDLLTKAGYLGEDAAKWEDSLLEVAGQFRPAWKHRVLPEGETPPENQTASWLAARTLKAVLQQVERMQERRGLYTFDDLIARVAHALDESKNPAAQVLIQRLRHRYRCAIVDEFQDTDPLQWEILKRLFVGTTTQRLFLVGDPKQAIFGFTGADLPTYFRAKEFLTTLPDKLIRPLDENWRSCPDLLKGLNQLFQACGWFSGSEPVPAVPIPDEEVPSRKPARGRKKKEIKPPSFTLPAGMDCEYTPVRPCPEEAARYKITTDLSDRSAINLVDLRACERLGGDARDLYSEFVAAEITRLLNHPERFQFQERKDGASGPLKPKDIAVLVFKRSEAKALMQALRRRKVPFTFFKETGLWQSDEVLQIGYALEALARPEDRRAFHRLLLSRFFRFPPGDLIGEDIGEQHPARRLFLDWVDLAENRAWSRLFTSFVEDSALLEKEMQPERCLANLRHILGLLEHAAYRDGLDLFSLLAFFRNQKQAPSADAGDYHPVETRQSKVQILTVHASKGLEYPVVFLAGGFTTKNPSSGYAQYGVDEGKVFHLGPDAEAKEKQKSEKRLEECRLLYVALTRAVFKLYLPYLPSKEEKRLYSPGPTCLLLRPALDGSGLPAIEDKAARLLSPLPSLDGSRVYLPPKAEQEASTTLDGPLFPALDANLWRRRIALASFSSLSRRLAREQPVIFGDHLEREDEDEPATLTEKDPLGGAEFGDLVHRVLEKIDWTEIGKAASPEALTRDGAPARRLLDQEIRLTLPSLRIRMPRPSLEALCRERVGLLAWHALTTRLPGLDGPLWRVPLDDRLTELEFLFPDDQPRDEEGFLNGYIDLVLRHKGRYYLLDWKTNQLDAYDQASLDEAMREADYTRQYRLYAAALARWLRRIHGDAFNLDDHFGGVFYLFLRGMKGAENQEGIFFVKPREEDLNLKDILSLASGGR